MLSKINLSAPFVDVGAAIGHYSRIMTTRAPLVVAIEPDPISMVVLKRNMRDRSNIKFLQVAIGNTRRKAKFYRYHDIGSGSISPFKGGFTHPLEVNVIPLSEVIHERVGLVKVDVEGAECEVLEGARPIMYLVDRWLIEIHGDNDEKVRKMLTETGYSIRQIDVNHIYACHYGVSTAEDKHISTEEPNR